MKIVVIGGGSIGKRHIRNLLSLGVLAEDIACLKRAEDPGFETATGVRVIVDRQQLSAFQPDAIIIATPTSLHLDGLKLAIELQAAVFMEKPLIHDAGLLTAARDLMKNHSQPFFIGFMLRFHPLVKRMKAFVDQEPLGKIWGGRFEFGSYLPYWHPWEDHRDSYASRKELGGGVINTISHELDLVLYFFGMPAQLFCKGMNFGKLGIEVEEMAVSIFQYSDKLVNIQVDYLQKDYNREIKLLCDEGRLVWNWHDNCIKVYPHKGEVEEWALENFDVNQLYVDELASFLELVQHKTLHHPLDFAYAADNTACLLKMHESDATGSMVKLDN